MLVKLSKNSYVRQMGEYGYITNQLTRLDRVYNETGADFLTRIQKMPLDVDSIIAELHELYGESVDECGLREDFISFVKELEQSCFVVTGDTMEEIENKDIDFSYSLGNPDNILKNRTIALAEPDCSTTDFMTQLSQENPRLISMEVEITSGCNERCIHCYIPNKKKDKHINLSYGAFCKLVDEFAEMGGLQIVLSGGEVFLHPDLFSMIEYCREKDLRISILSNLTKLREGDIERLKKVNLASIQTSLYSLNPENHDYITRIKGSCEKTKAAIEMLIKADIPVQISCPAMKANYKDYGEVIQYARQRGCKVQTDLILMAQSDLNTENLSNRMSLEEAEYVIKDILRYDEDYKNVLLNNNEAEDNEYIHSELFLNQPLCGAGSDDISITANGDVYPCAGWQKMVVGNIHKQSLKDIWNNSEELKRIRAITQKDFPQCLDCEALKFCSRCFVRNYNESNGDMLKLQKHFCDVAFLNKRLVEEFLKTQS